MNLNDAKSRCQMRYGGDGVIDHDDFVSDHHIRGFKFQGQRKKFEIGGRLSIKEYSKTNENLNTSCVLCGGILYGDDHDMEHPLPQWLHSYAENVADRRASSFWFNRYSIPTWRQLELAAHRSCNQQFAKKIERPAMTAIKSIVEGRRVTADQLQMVMNWMDKIKSSVSHMSVALSGNILELYYNDFHFPDRRIGLHDRFMIAFRCSGYRESLDLWECVSESFVTTPAVFGLQIKDLILVYASNFEILSDAFGLNKYYQYQGQQRVDIGTGQYHSGLGHRGIEVAGSMVIAQPMRRQLVKSGYIEPGNSLFPNGDGKVFQLVGGRWNRVKSIKFTGLPRFPIDLAKTLASIEIIEWLIINKNLDHTRNEKGKGFFMRSMPELLHARENFRKLAFQMKTGLWTP